MRIKVQGKYLEFSSGLSRFGHGVSHEASVLVSHLERTVPAGHVVALNVVHGAHAFAWKS